MLDPLAEVVTLLQPSATMSKVVSGAGAWRVRRTDTGQPFYCAILAGGCRLSVSGQSPITLQTNDFVLIPAAYDFSMTSLEPMTDEDADTVPVEVRPRDIRVGTPDSPADVQLLIGHCAFGSPDAALLVSLLPQLVHIRSERRLAMLVELVTDEARAQRPARDVILAHLLEVMFIEALRSTANVGTSPGLLRGLGDERLAVAIRQMHEYPNRPWTVVQLAKEAALSRSTFFERFTQALGMAPMAYLLGWRMALAKNLLRRKDGSINEIAQRVGYSSASAFSVAFSRYTGLAPARYSREAIVV
ncbi:AraC family transcriptional regulator [Pseudomonas sp. 10B1]|uniref:AraC family transcriptional regulator n=1 Tax=unclassified Pseudomonas TaxID=196821 RepID=UPI002AB586A1|nr:MULTISPECIES: AraC family transcriptional regulator [unclassified Pseudomonas]MDY7561362.1 AraC family transcriptional regulator [Pseudomonas sp. AB6]MEA9978496.1 AraC family transcriptional regulator [Pseudomonas sp. RTS4]MEA9996765.1 AraC family transcriptional regulator [Pseudomonas sp. AA4]MEB0088882.1 AraC family transcriptional regulator [Pseudomonas sp. RTI1]MEB0128265.1 AraC family transcriptional regulator [Pseudomonas sp. CCC1.2]